MARISSVGDLVIVVLSNKLLRRANDWWLKSSFPANQLDAASERGIGDMLEVPRHQVLYAMKGCDGDM